MYFFMLKNGKKRFDGIHIVAKRSVVILLLFVNLLKNMTVFSKEPSLYATSATLMDADTGRVLYEKNGDVFMSNASTTKIMTCILTLELADLEEIVEISDYAAGMPKVKLYVKKGEHYRLGDLLYSLMLESHNDTAVAIAEHVGGSMQGFATLMNEKAKEIGCSSTWFVTPNGLDATQTITKENGETVVLSHGTTANDLALMMAYCTFESPKAAEFLHITRTPNYSFVNQEGRSFSCQNHNTFLNMMDGMLSGKTGFTNKAGYCYVGAFEKDGKRFTVSILACGWPNHKTWKWEDARELLNYGLEEYTYHSVSEVKVDESFLRPIRVENGQTLEMGQTAFVNVCVKDSNEEKMEGLLLASDEKIEIECKVEEVLHAPVEKGTVVGLIQYKVGELCIREEKIVTTKDVPAIDFLWCISRIVEKYFL